MDFLRFPIQQNWQSFQQAEKLATGRRYRLAQYLVVLSALAVFFVHILPLSPRLTFTLQTASTSALFLAFASLQGDGSEKPGPARFLLRYGCFLLPVCLAGINYPATGQPGVWYWNAGKFLLSLMVPVVSWLFLFWFWRRPFGEFQWPALFAGPWLLNLLLGIFAGGGLILHLAYSFLRLYRPDLSQFTYAGPILWALSWQLGLAALGEELFFRGYVFNIFHGELRHSLWASILHTAGLVLLLDVVHFIPVSGIFPFSDLVIILYRFCLSMLNAFLFHRTGSLIPGLTSNVIFTTVLWLATH